MFTMSTNQPVPLEAARELVPRIRVAADQIDAQRELPRDLVDAIADAGLFRMLVPRSFGGSELDLPTYIRVIEELAKADGSTAWCVNQAAVFATTAAFLCKEVAHQIWVANPRAVIANGPAPSAEAVVVEDGYRVTGRWTFSSGCCHATWLAGIATIVENGQPRPHPAGTPEIRYMLFPQSKAKIIDTWHVRGLRGTGSHHFAVTDLFVPSECTVWTYDDPVQESGPLYLYPMRLHFAQGFASVALGIARSALDALIELSHRKKPRSAKDLLRDQAMVQAHVGQAEATVRSARAFLYETVHEVWETVVATHTITLEQRVLLRMATTHAIRLAAEAVDLVYNMSGTSAIYTSNPIQRCFQDIHVITQHIQSRLAHYELVGQFFLGLTPSQEWL